MTNVGRPRKDIQEESEVQSYKQSDAKIVTRTSIVEGLIHDLEAFIANLPEGEIPIGIIPEASTKRTLGRTRYVVVTKISPGSTSKAKLVSAVGIEDLNKALTESLTDEHTMFFLSAPINKRSQQSQYLVVIVRD
jgi:hypothetical protein